MRAYRKTATQHDFCVYLTAAEVVDLVNEAADAVNSAAEPMPALDAVFTKLNALLADPKKERA